MIRLDILLIPDSEIYDYERNRRLTPYERASMNRRMVKDKACIKGYLEIEAWLRGHKSTDPLPNWIRTNEAIHTMPK